MPHELGFDDALRERVLANLAGFPRRTVALEGRRAAAVAVALVADTHGRPSFLITRRGSKLRRHAGQWALPGGRVDTGEAPVAAALRELGEELGLEVDPADVLGLLDDYPTRSGFVITPVVLWGGRDPVLRPDSTEVAAVYRVPLAELAKPGSPRLRTIPESDRPVISLPLLGTQIHAPTAAILYQLLEVAVRGHDTRVDHFEQPVFAWR